MTEYYRHQETDLRKIIYANAVKEFQDIRGRFILDDFNTATSLFALCLIEFYGVDRNQIFYRKNDKIYNIEHREVKLDRLSEVH